MPKYVLHILDGKEARVSIEADTSHHAIDTGVEALARFVCKHFPPPENLQISVSDENDRELAKISFAFRIEYAPGVVA